MFVQKLGSWTRSYVFLAFLNICDLNTIDGHQTTTDETVPLSYRTVGLRENCACFEAGNRIKDLTAIGCSTHSPILVVPLLLNKSLQGSSGIGSKVTDHTSGDHKRRGRKILEGQPRVLNTWLWFFDSRFRHPVQTSSATVSSYAYQRRSWNDLNCECKVVQKSMGHQKSHRKSFVCTRGACHLLAFIGLSSAFYRCHGSIIECSNPYFLQC